ncbi:MAG: RIP metalloprotease RseP [Bdellovibrionota bacterium]
MLFYLISFILLLGPLVFVHEFGHFLFAKIFKVRVDVFSMGFGPKIFKKTWGETEYCLSVVPLGGYVKLYGQDPTETIEPHLRHRALNNLEAWKRFLVFVGGPLFNFLFAIFVFALILVIGEEHMAPVIGRVVPGSQAYVAGFRSGDVITAIDRNVVTKFEEVSHIVTESPNKELVFRVKRSLTPSSAEQPKSQVREIKVMTQATPGFSIYGESIEVGDIEGLHSVGRYTTVGVSNPKSDAGKAGLKTGDEILVLNGKPVKNWEELQEFANAELQRGASEFKVGYVPHELAYWLPESKPQPSKQSTHEVTLPAKPLAQLGIYSSELFIATMVKDSPSQLAGLMPGDRLVSVDMKRLDTFQDLREQVQKSGKSKGSFELTVEREGKLIRSEVKPSSNEVRDAAGNETKQFMIGVYPLFVQAEPLLFSERIFNPLTLTVQAWSRALDLSAKTLVSIKKLFFRQVSVGTLGGPILIGKLAGDSMSRGISQFLKVMALISISLAIFNILPIPILDGGHIFLLLVEVIRGRPISIRQTEVVQQVGLSLIVLLLVVVLFNDISKVGLPALRQMFQ